MRLDGRRESSNVDDRRRAGGMKTAGGLGIGAIVVALLIAWISGKNPLEMIGTMGLGDQPGVEQTSDREFTAEEQAFATFSKQVLAGTEDVWTEVFKANGLTYTPPTMVLFTGGVQTGCGGATSQVGPFYCSADQCLYIDLSFFTQMKEEMGAGGDFAYAYVIAHEVGHHVQNLLGTLGKAHSQMSQLSQEKANKISVRIELQADFYAGVWAYHDNKMFGSIEDGDIEEALNCASKIGDDYLQKQARGYVQPESFTHGTAKQRERWLKLGLSTGDLRRGDTFSISESQL
ncbi:MAG: zinc metallopeptidase [Bacteroidaceae bacterium]|nr:zinc metallopeptidase [Bacteroidaceae bacterium]